jgi:large subunit ribosomal protein L5
MEAATPTTEQAPGQAAPPPRLRDRYRDEVVPALVEKFGYATPMSVPRITKVIVNMGVGEASRTSGLLEEAVEELATITGQRPNVRRAKKSIAAFKIRDGMPVGCAVTLRKARMWEFLDRLITIATPRIRDFRGYNARAFDGRGNFTLGIREQIIFPEIDYDSVSEVRGLDVSIATTAETDEEAFELLFRLGFPFAEEGRPGTGVSAEEEAEAEEEARREEARARAEAEQAALEQLKEENPEAYAKPEPAEEEGEEGAEGTGEGESKPSSGEEE